MTSTWSLGGNAGPHTIFLNCIPLSKLSNMWGCVKASRLGSSSLWIDQTLHSLCSWDSFLMFLYEFPDWDRITRSHPEYNQTIKLPPPCSDCWFEVIFLNIFPRCCLTNVKLVFALLIFVVLTLQSSHWWRLFLFLNLKHWPEAGSAFIGVMGSSIVTSWMSHPCALISILIDWPMLSSRMWSKHIFIISTYDEVGLIAFFPHNK